MKKCIDLVADIGESFGSWKMGDDKALLEILSSANVACGFHAGDPHVMRKTIALAKAAGVAVGAHPGLPDLLGFGRRYMHVSPAELQDIITYQLGALAGFLKAAGLKMQHVLQHGALTAMAEKDEKTAQSIIDSIIEIDPEIIYLAMEGSHIPGLAKASGLNVKMIAFADRAYDKSKSLVSRKVDGAVIHERSQIMERIDQLISDEEITTLDGEAVPLEFDSIMLHGDSPNSVAIAQTVYETVKERGVEIKPLGLLSG
jgi:UPF0271 protein